MKNVRELIHVKHLVSIMIGGAVVIACNTQKTEDAKEYADYVNEQKFDSTANFESDAAFAVKAAEISMLEVKLGELAQTNAGSPSVKQMAQDVVKDHYAAVEELRRLATAKNITLPDSVGKQSYKDFERLSDKRGKEFDKAYCELMIKGHKQAIDQFVNQTKIGSDESLRSWAAQKIPMLNHHLETAEKTNDGVRNDKQSMNH